MQSAAAVTPCNRGEKRKKTWCDVEFTWSHGVDARLFLFALYALRRAHACRWPCRGDGDGIVGRLGVGLRDWQERERERERNVVFSSSLRTHTSCRTRRVGKNTHALSLSTHTHTRTCTHAHAHTHTRTCTHAHSHTHIHKVRCGLGDTTKALRDATSA